MSSNIETIRQENIIRNKNFLKDLGLESNHSNINHNQYKTRIHKKNTDTDTSLPTIIVRRSLRTSNIPINYNVKFHIHIYVNFVFNIIYIPICNSIYIYYLHFYSYRTIT